MTNKNLTYGLLITFVISIFGLFTPAGKTIVQQLGASLTPSGPVHYQTETFSQGLISSTESQFGTAVTNYVGDNLATGATYGVWYNNTGTQVFAHDGIMGFTGTASSSYRFALFATTTNPANFVTSQAFTAANGTAGLSLIAPTTYATSTTATTTNSVIAKATGVVPVPSASYLVFYVQKGDQSCASLPAVNGCEAATSTNRGIIPFWKVHLFR